MSKRKSLTIRYFLWGVMYLLFQTANAQPERFYFNHLTQSDGLSQTLNHYIYKDSYGFVWISSINGLNRYDGHEIRVYKNIANDSTSLPDNIIQSGIVEDNHTNLWFTTYEGLNCYIRKNDQFVTYRDSTEDGIPKKGYHLALDNNGSQLGIIVNEKEFKLFDIYQKEWLDSPLNSFPSSMYRALPLFDSTGAIEGLISFYHNAPGFYFFNFKDPSEQSYSIRFNGKKDKEPAYQFRDVLKLGDTLIMATKNGFLKLSLKDTTDWNFIPTPNWFPNRLSLYGKDKFIASLNGGGWRISNRENIHIGRQYFHNPKDPHSLASNNTYGAWIDKDNVIWTGVSGIGIDFTQPQKVKFKEIDIAQLFGISDRTIGIHAIVEDNNGLLWCSSRSDGVFVLSTSLEPLRHFSMLNKNGNTLPNDDVFNIFFDEKDRCWALTYNGGLGVLENGKSSFKLASGKKENFLFGIELRDKRVLFSPSKGGISLLKETTNGFDFTQVSQFDTLNFFTHLYQNRKGWLYLNKDISSILIVDPNIDFKSIDTLPIKGDVFCYYEELNSNIIWIATKNGLVRFDQEQSEWETYTEADGLPDQQIYSVIGDDKGTLWLTTNRGMVRFFPDEKRFQVFSKYDGIQGLEYNTNAYLKRSNGEFWFGGTQGINIFNPNYVEDLQVKTNPTITDIIINNESSPDFLEDEETKATNISLINKLKLSYDQNDLIFQVAALEYSDPSANEYFFKMIFGRDTIVRRGKKSTFEYPNMQPGEYTLIYNASNSDGVMQEDWGRQLEILITPPWWKTLWAYLLYFISATGIIYGFYRYRIAQIRKEAQYKQLVAETETAVLRLQMNPHFIFNSMNSINSYILHKDIGTASDYLGRFAQLMRMILDFAAKPLIEVTDEVELLTLYLQTESIRFGQRFGFSIKSGDGFDPDDFLIPPMILQPFVENSILHAFTGKKEKGQITIRFWEDKNSLFCSVEDDGIGREAASQKNQTAKTHESKALAITKRRMELLEQKNGIVSSIEFIDLYDKNNNPAGSRVLLHFPIF